MAVKTITPEAYMIILDGEVVPAFKIEAEFEATESVREYTLYMEVWSSDKDGNTSNSTTLGSPYVATAVNEYGTNCGEIVTIAQGSSATFTVTDHTGQLTEGKYYKAYVYLYWRYCGTTAWNKSNSAYWSIVFQTPSNPPFSGTVSTSYEVYPHIIDVTNQSGITTKFKVAPPTTTYFRNQIIWHKVLQDESENAFIPSTKGKQLTTKGSFIDANTYQITGLTEATSYKIRTRLDYYMPSLMSDWDELTSVLDTKTTPEASPESCVNVTQKLTLSSTSSGIVTYTLTATVTNGVATTQSKWITRLYYKTSSGDTDTIDIEIAIPRNSSSGTYTEVIRGLTPGDTITAHSLASTTDNIPELTNYYKFKDKDDYYIAPSTYVKWEFTGTGNVSCTVYGESSGGGSGSGSGSGSDTSSETAVDLTQKVTLSSTKSGVVDYTLKVTSTNGTATVDSTWTTTISYLANKSKKYGSVTATVTIKAGKSSGTYTGSMSGLTGGETFSMIASADGTLTNYDKFVDDDGNYIVPTSSDELWTASISKSVSCTVASEDSGDSGDSGGSSSGGDDSGGGSTSTAILKWSWDYESGSWNADETVTDDDIHKGITADNLSDAWNAVSFKGSTRSFSRMVWDDMTEWLLYVSGKLGTSYGSASTLGVLASDNILTADAYNDVIGAVNAIINTASNASEIGLLSTQSTGDSVLGTYIILIVDKVNTICDAHQ